MHDAQFSLVTFSYPHRPPYKDGQTKGVRACGSIISNLRSQYLLPRSGLRSGRLGFTMLECRGWSIVDTMDANLVASFKHTTFPIIQNQFHVVPSH